VSEEQVRDLITELRRVGRECTWAEFKCNNEYPEMIAEYVSAMSNSAAMDGAEYGYVVWGLRDVTLDVVGTTFKPKEAKKGNEPLINWLVRSTQPHLDIEFFVTTFEGKEIVVLRIPRALNQPVRVGSEEFIRIDSQKRKLKDYPEHARRLWASFNNATFEVGSAMQDVDGSRVLQLLAFTECFDRLKIALPLDQAGILARLSDERFIVARVDPEAGR
jgi:predicted HTH transcriptional regulator